MDGEIVTLYNKDAKGNLRTWSIWIEGDLLHMEYGIDGMKMTNQAEVVEVGKVNRTQEEQILSRMQSRINSKLDAGYVYNKDDLKSGVKNSLGFKKPMLAKRYDQIKEISTVSAFIQYKYDGHRCLITNQSGEKIAYSRNGKRIETIDHIVNELNIPEGVTLDGELYMHGKSLQSITSFVKRKQPMTESIIYVVYDAITPEPIVYLRRLELLRELLPYELIKNSMVADTHYAPNYNTNLNMKLKNAIEQGYEGLIIRTCDSVYEDGKRSNGLIKVKASLDAEFKVIGIHPSAEGWAILDCLAPNGETFSVSAPGSISEKLYVMKHEADYLGKYVTIQYPNLTDRGVPFHPVALRWKQKI